VEEAEPPDGSAAPVVTPLQKKNRQGKLYRRSPEVEGILHGLARLPYDEVVRRCSIRDWEGEGYVPSECLVYLFRSGRGAAPNAFQAAIFKLLQTRLLKRFVPAGSASDTMTKSSIREKVYYEFIQMLARDRSDYEERLDYYEVRFDGAVANLRKDAQDKYWKEEGRRALLEVDEESGEFTREVREALGDFDPFAASNIQILDYRLRLDAAIDSLSPEQRRIVQMIGQEIPIHSNDPSATTIAKALGKSEKMIRIYRDRAFARLRAILEAGGGR
jgi:DNA-binding CsgD family transcriptional regulator